jgi:hypothetical protein
MQIVAQALAGAKEMGGLWGDAKVHARRRGLRRYAALRQLVPR